MASEIRRMIVGSICMLAVSGGIVLPVLAAPVTFSTVTATYCQSGWPVSTSIDGSFSSLNGWAIDPQEGSNKIAVYKTVTDINGQATELTFNLHMLYLTGHSLGRFRLAATTSSRGLYGQGSECADANPEGTAVWTVLYPQSAVSANGQTLSIQPDGSILASGYLPDTDVVTVRVTTQQQGITGFRLETLADGSLPYGGPGRYPSNGNFVLTEFVADAQSQTPVPTLSTLAMGLTSMLLGSIGILWLRRRNGLSREGHLEGRRTQ